MPRLETNFFEIVDAVVNEKIKALNLNWYNNKTLSIVLCSKGYPGKFENGNEIKNLKDVKLKKNEFIFHAGTKISNSKIFSNGGRVLNFVVKSESFEECRFQAIDLINKINWNQGFFRKDIGYRVIDK